MSAKRTRLDNVMDGVLAAASAPEVAEAPVRDEARTEQPKLPSEAAARPESRYKVERVYAPGTDGRVMRATGRDRAFATKIKPDAHEDLKGYAYRNGITIAEALERAIALLVTQDQDRD